MKKILLIEDDKKIALALGLRLRSMGFETAIAADAICAMAEALRFCPDMILLDINLPGGNGFLVAERIRSSMAIGSTPIVFITASKRQENRAEARKYGASGFLEKPFSIAQLSEVIDTCTYAEQM
jgi:two-component system copper resistance phosphate regulon response regulator CusR